MQKNVDFFTMRERNCLRRIDLIKKELPYYCDDFFIGVEGRTTPLTRLNYAYDLRVFFGFLQSYCFKNKNITDIMLSDLDELKSSDIEQFISFLGLYEINGKTESCGETGKARKLSTIRSFFKFLFDRDMIHANVASKVLMPKQHEKEIIRLDSGGRTNEIVDFIDVVDSGEGLTGRQTKFHNLTKVRDLAIVTLFLGTGIRISELVGLNVGDVNFEQNSFVVTRKGGNRSILYFGDEVCAALENYVFTERNLDPKANRLEPLFLSLKGERISVRAVEVLVKKYALIATPLKKITPHKLRSTFGTNLYKQTGDIYVVADCLGHKDVNTTKKHYAAITEDIRKNAGKSVNLRGTNNDSNDENR